MALWLFAVALLGCLFLIPMGLPGLWGMVLMLAAFGPLTATLPFSWGTVGLAAVLSGFAELVEFLIAGRFARRYGGSGRAAWGAVLGGLVGAVIGVPMPIAGSMVGAFLGCFMGALIGEMGGGTSRDTATRAATGALLGRIAAVGLKIGLGFVLMVWLLAAHWLRS